MLRRAAESESESSEEAEEEADSYDGSKGDHSEQDEEEEDASGSEEGAGRRGKDKGKKDKGAMRVAQWVEEQASKAASRGNKPSSPAPKGGRGRGGSPTPAKAAAHRRRGDDDGDDGSDEAGRGGGSGSDEGADFRRGGRGGDGGSDAEASEEEELGPDVHGRIEKPGGKQGAKGGAGSDAGSDDDRGSVGTSVDEGASSGALQDQKEVMIADPRRVRLLNALLKLLTAGSMLSPLRKYHSRALLCLGGLLLVHIMFYVLLTQLVNKETRNIHAITDLGTAIRAAQRLTGDVERLAFCAQPGANATYDMCAFSQQAFLEDFGKRVDRMSTAHMAVYLGTKPFDVHPNGDGRVMQLWTEATIPYTITYDTQPTTTETLLSGLFPLGNIFVAAAREVHQVPFPRFLESPPPPQPAFKPGRASAGIVRASWSVGCSSDHPLVCPVPVL